MHCTCHPENNVSLPCMQGQTGPGRKPVPRSQGLRFVALRSTAVFSQGVSVPGPSRIPGMTRTAPSHQHLSPDTAWGESSVSKDSSLGAAIFFFSVTLFCPFPVKSTYSWAHSCQSLQSISPGCANHTPDGQLNSHTCWGSTYGDSLHCAVGRGTKLEINVHH